MTAATLLMMAWAIFPSSAFASTEGTPWGGNGADKLPCSGTTHWIFSGWGNDFDEVSNPVLTVNGTNYPMSQQGNGNVFEAFVPGPLAANPTASASWAWNEEGDKPTPVLTISSCDEDPTTSTQPPTTTTQPPTTTTQPPTTTTEPPTTTTEPPTTTTEPPTTTTEPPTTTTQPPTTTTEPPTTTTEPPTTTTEPPTTTTQPPTTTTEPPTSTTEPPTVSPTTVTPSEDPTTTTPPGGTAFTGVDHVVPLGALALVLMTAGSGLLWAGSRLRLRKTGSKDED